MEDGVEHDNIVSHNLAAYVRMIGPLGPEGGQGGFSQVECSRLICFDLKIWLIFVSTVVHLFLALCCRRKHVLRVAVKRRISPSTCCNRPIQQVKMEK